MTNTPNDASQSGAVENQIELREVEGLSQGQIVRRRFFHHKGAVVALIVLIGIVALAITSIGIGGWQGWYAYKPSGQGSTYPWSTGVHRRRRTSSARTRRVATCSRASCRAPRPRSSWCSPSA